MSQTRNGQGDPAEDLISGRRERGYVIRDEIDEVEGDGQEEPPDESVLAADVEIAEDEDDEADFEAEDDVDRQSPARLLTRRGRSGCPYMSGRPSPG